MPTYDLDLDFVRDRPANRADDRAARAAGPAAVSLLLTSPPGTGKTALAHHLARALDRPPLVKRESDLLSRWVGGTEAAITDAFADARESGSVLLFDEVDSFLFDRTTAMHSWKAGQVNEMLTWLDRHPSRGRDRCDQPRPLTMPRRRCAGSCGSSSWAY